MCFENMPWAGAETQYSDVPENHWAYKSIAQTTEWGWVNGTAVGRFEPGADVTGAQFTVMLIRAFLPDSLNDSTGGKWYSAYSNAAKKLGLLKGTTLEDDVNGLDSPLRRYDMSQQIYNLLSGELEGELTTLVGKPEDKTQPADWDQIPENYREAVNTAFGLKILNGVDDNGNFSGEGSVTRAQAAEVLLRLDSYLSGVKEPEPGKVGTFSTKPVALSYETHCPIRDYWSSAPEDIRKLTDKDAYNAAVQTLKDHKRIRWAEGLKHGETQYYNYAVYRRKAGLKETAVTGAMSRLGGGGAGFTPRSAIGADGALGYFGADIQPAVEEAMLPVLNELPSGSDWDKAAFLTQKLCEKFKYSETGAFTWTSLGVSGTANSFSNAAAALFTNAGIPYICASGRGEDGAHFWGYTLQDGVWYVTDAAAQAQSGNDSSHLEMEAFLSEGGWKLDTFTRVAMALAESANIDN